MSTPASTRSDDAQRLRLQRLYMAAVSSLVSVAVTAGVSLFGYLPVAAAASYAGIVLLLIAIFYALFKSGRNLRFADPSLTMPQLMAAGMAVSYLVYEGHAARPAFMFFYLTAFVFGVFVLNPRRLLWLGLFYLACYAAVAALALATRPEVTDLSREIFRLVALTAILGWLIVLGRYMHRLQRRLAEAKAEVTSLLREQRLVFDTAIVGIAHVRDRTIVDCNAHFLAMFGYAAEEVIGQSTRLLFEDEASWESAGASGYAALREGRLARREIVLRTKSGERIECDVALDCLVPLEPERGVVLILNDITVAKRREMELHRALLEQKAIFNNAPAGIVFVRKRLVEDCNEMLVSLFGYSREEWIGQSTRRVFATAADWEWRGREMHAAFARGESYSYEAEFVRKNGGRIWCRVRGGAIDPVEKEEGSVVYVIVDISDRKRAESALRQSREHMVQVIRASQSGIWDYNLETGDVVFSSRFFEILGLPVTTDSASIMPIEARLHPDDAERVLGAYKAHLRQRMPLDIEFRLRKGDDSYVWVRGYGQATWDGDMRANRLVGSIVDISGRKRQEEEIRQLAMQDPLTGLPNRRLLEDRLAHALGVAGRNRERVALMLIDLDGFKAVNDEHGHEAGDIVLRAVAQRLLGNVRSADTVARAGGDEFVVLAEGIEQVADVAAMAGKLLACLREPIAAGDYQFQIGASIGIAIYPSDSEQPAQLIRLADKAMYAVKESGRNGYRFYSGQADAK